MQIAFGVESYRLRSKPLSAQRLVNCYLEPAPPRSKTQAAVTAAYGISSFAEASSGLVRGGLVRNGIPYVVIGDTLYSVADTGALTALGTIPGNDFVDIAGDERNLMVTTASADYFYNGSAVSQITDEDYPGADWVENLDGYFIISSGGQFYVSANRDPSSWDGLDFATAEKYPDDIVGGIIDHSELILFGKESGEVWYDSGDQDFPLSKVPSGDFEVGAIYKKAMCRADNGVFFVGHDGIGYRLNGYTPQRFTTYAIEQAIEDADDKNIVMFSWKEAGHEFVALRTSEYTFVYDCSTQLFHERVSYGLDNWRSLFVLRAYNRWIVGDATSSKLGILDPSTFTEWGDILRASATSPPVAQDNARMAHSRVELVFEAGVGTTTGQGSDPQVMLRWSDNDGRQWSNEHWRSLGAQGAYEQRACWNRVGQARGRIYEYAITDPVRRTLIMATTEAVTRAY